MSKPRLMHKLFIEESQVDEVVVEQEVTEPVVEETPESFDWNSLDIKIIENDQKVSKKLADYKPEEAAAYIQKGYDYDRVKSQLEEARSAPELQFMNDFLQKNGYNSFSEYQEALAINELKQQPGNEGLTDTTAKEILDGRRAREEQAKIERAEAEQRAAEEKKQADYLDFINKFPDVKADDIDPEAFVLNKQGIPLAVAHELTQLRKGNDKTKIEQDTLRKLQENSDQAAGSVTKGNPTHTTSIKDMSKSDFEAMKEAVKRGEKKEL